MGLIVLLVGENLLDKFAHGRKDMWRGEALVKMLHCLCRGMPSLRCEFISNKVNTDPGVFGLGICTANERGIELTREHKRPRTGLSTVNLGFMSVVNREHYRDRTIT